MVEKSSKILMSSEEVLATKLRLWQMEINEELKKKRFKVPVHLGLGTEALVVAIASVIDIGDNLLLTHRNAAFNLVMAEDPKAVVREYEGLNDGLAFGQLGSMNLVNPLQKFRTSFKYLLILFVLLGISAASFSNTPLPKAALTKPNIPYFFLGTNNVDITVSSSPTSGGSWSGGGTSEGDPYIFTPSGTATATINSTDLANYISTKPYVTITTVSSSVLTCTGNGNITFSSAIASSSSLTSNRIFKVNASINLLGCLEKSFG